MALESLSPVRLLTDRHRAKGIVAGAIGVIVEVYNDAYEVEFSRPDGATIAWFAVDQAEVEPSVEAELAARGRNTS